LKKLIISLLLSFGFLFGEEGKNLLLITIDTIRPDRISFYSSKYLKTANIDSVAKSGVVFMRAFAHNPTTLPSHTNILLGTTPLYHGVHDNSHFKVDERFTTLAEFLKKYGFSTGAFIGSFPLDSRFGLSQGFDLYDDSYPSKGKEELTFPERKAEKVIESALNWIKNRKTLVCMITL
jgi:Arylsulfatase A and related enzymes